MDDHYEMSCALLNRKIGNTLANTELEFIHSYTSKQISHGDENIFYVIKTYNCHITKAFDNLSLSITTLLYTIIESIFQKIHPF